jgi:NitT/TauT family transport system substrate-binding protein
MAASIIAGRISVAVLPEPFATMALRGNKDAHEAFSLQPLWKSATGLSDYPMTVVVAKRSLVNERPLALAAFLAAYEESIEKILADPAQAGTLVESHDLGLKAPIAAAAIPVSNYVFIKANKAKKTVQGLLEIFLAALPASIGGKLPMDSFYVSLPDAK